MAPVGMEDGRNAESAETTTEAVERHLVRR